VTSQRQRDPERPDPSEPSRERVRETLIERQIRAAMDEGLFDDLPHQGRRLPLDDDALSGERAMAHRMLKNAGFAPAWIEADKAARDELAAVDTLIARAVRSGPIGRDRARTELVRRVASANRTIARLNAEAPTDRQHRRPLDLASELDRFDEAMGDGDRR
jgi:DnaJ homolog subfamily C member 28